MFLSPGLSLVRCVRSQALLTFHRPETSPLVTMLVLRPLVIPAFFLEFCFCFILNLHTTSSLFGEKRSSLRAASSLPTLLAPEFLVVADLPNPQCLKVILGKKEMRQMAGTTSLPSEQVSCPKITGGQAMAPPEHTPPETESKIGNEDSLDSHHTAWIFSVTEASLH